ncbi:MAG TPA: nucleotidyltransferase family protein [Candidatus Limnocylindrales bacterium]|nr:nucleotidyltransferase family protein [Candidatus Limnocylindrales bacterium]
MMPPRVLVLAGRREGEDALAMSAGVAHRALLPIAGVPMLVRVIRTLRESGVALPIAVTAGDDSVLRGDAELAAWTTSGDIVFHRAGISPATTVAEYFETCGNGTPLFVTTADHPLLTPQIVRHFLAEATASRADFVVGLVAGSVFCARFPDQPRTFIVLRDEKFSGANLFLLRTPRALEVPRFWTRAEAFRKRPWRLASVFGVSNLALFVAGRLDLAGAMDRASHVIGADIGTVVLPFAEAALDVDKEADRIIAESLLRGRT